MRKSDAFSVNRVRKWKVSLAGHSRVNRDSPLAGEVGQ
jgi:hypothetical protein